MIMKFKEAAEILGIETTPVAGELVITGVSTDTRTIKPGEMFIAIKGENFDGGNYIKKAFDKGAVCAVTSRDVKADNVLVVRDPVKALGKLARSHRNKYKLPVIAVTGSIGKTTVKNYLVSIFSKKFNVHSTAGNKNNHIGLPMTLLGLNESHDISILEMGMSSPGEIDYLSYLASPSVAVITNIGMSHIGMLGSLENIFKAKTEVMNHMQAGGQVVVNGDDDFLCTMENDGKLFIIKYGLNPKNDMKAENVRILDGGNYAFKTLNMEYELNIPGKHNIYNAMAAITTAKIFKVENTLIREGISEYIPAKMRLAIFESEGIRYINDTYNANPQSMKAALDILAVYKGRKIAVLGDMLEMGNYSEKEHFKLGKYAASKSDILLFCGDEAENVKKGAGDAGKSDEIYLFKTSDDAGVFLKTILKAGDTVLLKGSRGIRMENVLKYTEDGGKL